ncbi:translation elongation factor G [Rhodopirellula baltica SH28]|uniref:Elongation factor G n=1 Tax=Rhodopirellula baltica SH28 TaxID=993517 RepID=K5DLZ4_RHOBT|nr:elongation factor G [Rhodopirellula baltica]EKK03498.1 translation elongation factor G [Rhodopirellula baltica SH28]
MNLEKVRNIGISAHIDSGKTTLSERILFYSGRIHKIEDVRGGGDGATMDHMELEKERGITITSAATSVTHNGYHINLIDTPGHVDFTVEVERSLRVLDGAVLVLCSVGGVQSQSITVDRQMKRYQIPRLAFINKMDRTGANPRRVVEQLREKLGADAFLAQIPIGAEENFRGVVDLIEMVAYTFEGDQGEKVVTSEIPADLKDEAEEARVAMLDSLSNYSDEVMELLLSEEEVSKGMIYKVMREAVLNGATPVYMGSAYKNKGVQPLLDAVTQYLPSPLDREIYGRDPSDETKKIELSPDPDKPFVGMAFKIVEDPFGQLTFMRIYQGTIKKGEAYTNQRSQKKERFSRIVRMHSEKREEIDEAGPGDIIAVMGIDCASGDTYCSERDYATLESMYVPEPVIKIAVNPLNRGDGDKMSKALQRFRKEDPTFSVYTDEETNEILISGMGELHLEIYIERIRREYGVEIEVGAPKVSYRESPTREVEFNYKHKKQTGGSGQYAHIVGKLIPIESESEDSFEFEEKVVGGRIPKQYIPAVEKGFRDILSKGPVADYPVVGTRIELLDGSYHDVDSSEKAFYTAAQGCFREYFKQAAPKLLEPIMKVEIECPEDFQGTVTGDVIRRRGLMTSNDTNEGMTVILAEVPLAETFGYATDLRSMTQGQGTFTMELAAYRQTPSNIQEEIIAERKKDELAGAR